MALKTFDMTSLKQYGSHNRVLAIISLISSLPLWLHFGRFQKLFWFSDDLALLHEWRVTGFASWLVRPFGENFVPLFKALWGAAVIAFDGAYLPMVIGLWIIHLAVVFAFGKLLIKAGFPFGAWTLAVLTLGLSWSNVDLLTFAYHWTAGLSDLFFLCALLLLFAPTPHVLYSTLLLAAGALSFSREIIGCAAAAGGSLFGSFNQTSPRKRAVSAAILLLPALFLMATLTYLRATPVVQSEESLHASERLTYGLYFFVLNPLLRLFYLRGQGFQPETVAALGLLKIALVIVGFRVSRSLPPSVKNLLIIFLLFDLGNSALLGYGRFQEGIDTTVVSRYQRISLIAFLPFASVCIAALFKNIRAARIIGITCLIAWATWIILPWSVHMKARGRWQGTLGRQLLLEKREPRQPYSADRPWQGIPPVITKEDADLTVTHFNLH